MGVLCARTPWIMLILLISLAFGDQAQANDQAAIPLESVETLAVTSIGGNAGASDPHELFLQWLRECGAKFDGLTLKNTTIDGVAQRGVFVEQAKDAFSEVARLPIACSITIDGALKHEELKDIWTAHPTLAEGRSPMAIQLLWERNQGEKSKLAPWLKLLPRALDLPVMWTRKEREALKGTYTLDRVLADLEGLTEDYEKVFVRALFKTHAAQFPEHLYTLEDYIWAWGIIWSRDIEHRVAGVWKPFLVPFVDMINHAPAEKANAELYVNFGKTELIVSLNGSVNVGAELLRNYIPQAPNIELLRMYGFLDPLNAHVVSCLPWSPNRQDPYFDRRIKWAKKYKLDLSADYPYNNLYVTNQGVPPNVPPLLRIAQYNFDTYASWYNVKDAPDPSEAMDNANEEKFFSNLRETLIEKLKAYPTTIEEDEQLLENAALPRRLQLAIEIRLEEKVALQGSIDSLATTVVRFDEPIDLNKKRDIVYPKRAANRGDLSDL